MCSETPSEKYWELLAEERRKALHEALDENKMVIFMTIFASCIKRKFVFRKMSAGLMQHFKISLLVYIV